MASQHRPNILVVVLDCVRASDFWRETSLEEYMPFIASFSRECVRFPRAVAPAPWTIPSHASLFTGLYPWEHGAHMQKENVLSKGVPTIAQALRDIGYATLSVSGNFLVSPFFGLTSGFEYSHWGGWWEPFLRWPLAEAERVRPHDSGPPNPVLQRMRFGDFSPLFGELKGNLSRHSEIIDVLVHLARKVRLPEDEGYPVAAPWIEGDLAQALQRVPKEQPTFCFVNLIDAHEPYFSTRTVVKGLGAWLRYARQRQDRQGWLEKKWSASEDELKLLHRLYRESIRSMDQRIRKLIEVLKASGRWEDSLVVITSDHGQAFGEHGTLYHMLDLSEEIVRIPMLVKFPKGEYRGTRCSRWASLVDVAPTVLGELGEPSRLRTSGFSLKELVDRDRSTPVLTVSDGLGKLQGASLPPERRMELNQIQAAAYRGEIKVVVGGGADTKVQVYIVAEPAAGRSTVWHPNDHERSSLQNFAEMAVKAMGSDDRGSLPIQVADRLRAWGYV